MANSVPLSDQRKATFLAELARRGILPQPGAGPGLRLPQMRDRLKERKLRDGDGRPMRLTTRQCLRYRKDFESAGPGNRLCTHCRSLAHGVSPYAP